MRRFSTYPIALAVVMACGLASAQDQPPQSPQQPQTPAAWRHIGDQAQPATAQTNDPEAVDRSGAQAGSATPSYGLPPQVTLKAGTFITIRTNQELSSDHSRVGDTFTGTLMQPLIVDGVVVASRGQMVYGRVTVAEKAHGGKDSRLGLELTSVSLADGTQAPVHSQLVAKQGPPMSSAQASTAVSSSAADSSAVLMTRDHTTLLYPSTGLTFSITGPVTINTANGSQAFRFAGPEDYGNVTTQGANNTRPRPQGSASYVYGAPAPAYYPYGYPYYSPYYPYYWGPSVGIGFGFGGFGGFGFRGRWR